MGNNLDEERQSLNPSIPFHLLRGGSAMNRRNFLLTAGAGGVLSATETNAEEQPAEKDKDTGKKLDYEEVPQPRRFLAQVMQVKCNGEVITIADDGDYYVNPGKIEVKTNPRGDNGTIFAIVNGLGTFTGGTRPDASEYVTWDPYEVLGPDQRVSIPNPTDPSDLAEATLNVVAGGRSADAKANTTAPKWAITFDSPLSIGSKPIRLRTSGGVSLGGAPVSSALSLLLIGPDPKTVHAYEVTSDELGRWVKSWIVTKGNYVLHVRLMNKKAKGCIKFKVL
jgi:hypothetical protein